MSPSRVSKLAKTLVHYSTQIQPGERVMIIAYPAAERLVREVYREVLRAGGHPHLGMLLDDILYVYYTEANDQQLGYVDPIRKLFIEEFESFIYIDSSSNTRELANTDPSRVRLHQQAFAPVWKTQMARTASGDLRWAYCAYPTSAYAMEANMSLVEFEDYLFATSFAEEDDPVASWQQMHDRQAHLVEWLAGKDKVHLQGPDVDLHMSIKDRPFINSSGHFNIPDGEIFTAPVEESVNSWIRFSLPAIVNAREVENIELHFVDGRVETATASKGQQFLDSQLDVDDGARFVGELGIGTNRQVDRFIKNMLFDEKMWGTIHIALGHGSPECGSRNESAIHWDLLCDMRNGGKIWVDDKLFYEAGEFLI